MVVDLVTVLHLRVLEDGVILRVWDGRCDCCQTGGSLENFHDCGGGLGLTSVADCCCGCYDRFGHGSVRDHVVDPCPRCDGGG